MQESNLTGLLPGVAPFKNLLRPIRHITYLFCFLPVFFTIRVVTGLLSFIRFKHLLAGLHRLMKVDSRVLYLEPFFPDNAGYHYRVQRWVEILNQSGFKASAKHVFERERFEHLLDEERVIRFQTVFLLRRVWQCMSALSVNCVIVRRELLLFNDYGNLFLEKFLLALHPNVILDFDDDISAAKREPRRLTLFGRLMIEAPSKFTDSLKLYRRFIVGSGYLKSLLLENNVEAGPESVAVIPTCVDYEKYRPKEYDPESEYVNFGWVGSRANHYLLSIVIPVLSDVARRHKIRFVLITSPEYKVEADFEVINIAWSLEREIENIHKIDIGLMPLYDSAEERGKCGFKLIQYMGLGVVSIASAVTINNEIVDDKKDGFLVYRESDWAGVIEEVLARRKDFSEIGGAARRKVAGKFSFEANKREYLDFVKAGVA